MEQQKGVATQNTTIDISKKLPTLQSLHHDVAIAFKNDQLNLLLNQQPIENWVKVNQYANNSKYLPIEKIEYMLTRIFQKWRVEVLEYKQIFNAITCSIRLHYLDPLTNEWSYHDGVGAQEIQTSKGCSPAELDKINKGAVQMALPAAKSYAIKDAAEHLGKLFGRDLNRKDAIAFAGAYMTQEEKQDDKAKVSQDATTAFTATKQGELING